MNSIIVPDGLPEILKNYVKAAIRSQPEDIISWSAEYFKTTDEQYAAIGIPRENGHCTTDYKQDRTLFRILAFQLGTTVGTKERIEEVWSDLSLDYGLLEETYRIGKFHGEHVDMVEFLGIAFGHWTKSLKETVMLCCEAFCKCLATDGYFLHVDVACKLYGFLAKLDCSPLPDCGNDGGGGGGGDDDGHDQEASGVVLDDRDEREGGHGGAENEGGGNNEGRHAVKSTMSLDRVSPAEFHKSRRQLFDEGNLCASLESVFGRPTTATDDRPLLPGYRVPGIGSPVPDRQVQTVFEYFRKCAADNGGYVYDFDIENDQCPPLDAEN